MQLMIDQTIEKFMRGVLNTNGGG